MKEGRQNVYYHNTIILFGYSFVLLAYIVPMRRMADI